MLYHFNIFLSSSLIQRRLGTPEFSVYIEQKTSSTKSFWRRILADLLTCVLPVTNGPFRLTKLTSGNGGYTDFLSARVCTWMCLDVSHPELVGSLPTHSTCLSDRIMRVEHLQVSSDASTTEALPRNRLINVFNAGKTSAGSENVTKGHISIKIMLSWFSHFICPPLLRKSVRPCWVISAAVVHSCL